MVYCKPEKAQIFGKMQIEQILKLLPNSIQKLLQVEFAFISSLKKAVKVNAVKHPQTPPQLFHLPPQNLRPALRLQISTDETSMEGLHEVVLVEIVKDQCVKGVA